jgi:hypothetical protein
VSSQKDIDIKGKIKMTMVQILEEKRAQVKAKLERLKYDNSRDVYINYIRELHAKIDLIDELIVEVLSK